MIKLLSSSRDAPSTTDNNESKIQDKKSTTSTKIDTQKTLTQQKSGGWVAKVGVGVGKIVATFNQAAKNQLKLLSKLFYHLWPLYLC